jgi:hypothetical protein
MGEGLAAVFVAQDDIVCLDYRVPGLALANGLNMASMLKK